MKDEILYGKKSDEKSDDANDTEPREKNELVGCVIVMLVFLHLWTIPFIVGGFELDAYWSQYSKSDVETICGTEYSKFIWEDNSSTTTPATLGLGLAILGISAIVFFIVNLTMFYMNCKFNYGVLALWGGTIIAQCCLAIYAYYYWEHMSNISKWCSDTDNEIKDGNDEIEDYLYPFSVIWAVFLGILALCLCVAGGCDCCS